MVYLYSVLCCLFLFPYLGWQGGKVLGTRGRKLLWGGLSFIFVLYAVAFLTHRHIQADWMSHIMNGSIYIFFSTMYAAGIVLLLQGLCLLGVRTARIQKDTVGFAIRVLIDLSNGCRRGSRNHGIGDAFGEDVQAQDGDHDECTGEDGRPPHSKKN